MNCFIFQVNQSRQGNSASYNTYSEYDSANHGQQNFNMQLPVQGNLGSLNHFSEYDSANLGGNFDMQQPVEGYAGSFNLLPEYDLANHGGQWLSDYINLQQQVPYLAPYENESEMIWKSVVEENFESLIDERTSMQEHYSDYRPKKPVTGVLPDDSSDTETGSMVSFFFTHMLRTYISIVSHTLTFGF